MLSDRFDKVPIMKPRLDSSSITRRLSFDISFQELPAFLDYWSSKYNDPNKRDETFYDPHIGKADLRTDEGAILDLFTWKNGMVLSERKKKVLWRTILGRGARMATSCHVTSIQKRKIAADVLGISFICTAERPRTILSSTNMLGGR